MKTEFDDRVKELFPLKNENITVKLQDHGGVDDNGYSKKNNSQPCRLGSFLLCHSKQSRNDIILAIGGFKSNKNYYSDTDSI